MFGLPIPMLTMDIGVPLYRPVIVRKPLSEERVNGLGIASKKVAIELAREGDPTVNYQRVRNLYTSDWPGPPERCLRSD